MVSEGDQVKLGCSFSTEEPASKGAVSWHRTGLRDAVNSTQVIGLRGRFSLFFPRTFLSEGDGSLIIRNVSWEDGGTYFCKVLIWDVDEKQGNGTKLVVYAHPSKPEIYLQVASPEAPHLSLTCRTHGFYPPPVLLNWFSSEISLAAPRPLDIWESEDGLFLSTSHLVLPSNARSRVITVTCIVQHVSLPQPLSANYTYNPVEHGMCGYSVIQYLNILKIALLMGLTVSMLWTVRNGRKGEK
ncbi:tyrosine-protein phosphatase non-receptor type substrate 1-like [Spea bombifrons]|uniref:tyrosine-protein phosphatase non-receptor type substrate 1-like n=1 Tax=Spea bombifrons TaxID=233779 RepID=UPI00234B9CD0|nr:tyrosine-protein phosphatase non-receptor type substrate 1-like [Spea bombifrons]